MNRGIFIKNLIGLFGVANLPIELIKEYRKIYLLHFFVRGFKFYDGPKIFKHINSEGLVDLIREADNKFDKNAIAIYFEGYKIGYVPREDNEVLTNIVDAKLLDVQAEITRIEPHAGTWEQISVAIFALKKTDDDNNIPKHLTRTDRLKYRTLKKDKNSYQRFYYEDKEMIDGENFYKIMCKNSSGNHIADVLEKSKITEEELKEAVENSRIIINKHRNSDKNKSGNSELDFNIEELFEHIENQIIEIENVFDEKGYIVANVEKVAAIPDSIERFVRKTDKIGNLFFEVVLLL